MISLLKSAGVVLVRFDDIYTAFGYLCTQPGVCRGVFGRLGALSGEDGRFLEKLVQREIGCLGFADKGVDDKFIERAESAGVYVADDEAQLVGAVSDVLGIEMGTGKIKIEGSDVSEDEFAALLDM